MRKKEPRMYHIAYVEDNEPKLRSFEDPTKGADFLDKLEAKCDDDACWVDSVIYGYLIQVNKGHNYKSTR